MSNRNSNASIVKNGKRKLSRYNLKRYYKFYPSKNNNRNLIYIALDSCIIIDMVKIIRGRIPTNKSHEYYMSLKNLLDRSVLTKNHKKNKKGDIVFCITPTVLKEISNEKGEIFSCLKKFINDRIIVFKVDESHMKSFNTTISKLTNKYYENDLFVNEKNELTTDAFVVAEASFFNLTLFSRDKHICIDFKDELPMDKIQKINYTNKKILDRMNPGPVAEPTRLKYLITSIDKWKSNESQMPKLENSDYLQEGIQLLMSDLDHRQPLKEDYGIEKL